MVVAMATSAPPLHRRAARPDLRTDLRARLRPLVVGRAGDPRWVRPTLLAVLAVAAVLCLWNLSQDGYSNTYYASAVKSATESWKAWFFGALDPGSFITVDKPPLALWLMGLSARVFGFSSFAMLLPDALCTIAAVGLLYATVRRAFGPAAGLAAAAALATTPITSAIARVNNPDALLVLLLVASAWFTLRAIESGRTKHLLYAGAVVGLAFMTKMLQGWMVVPALAAAYLLAGSPRLGRRVRQLAAAGGVMVAVSAAWPLAVTLWPGSAPYIGGSTNGSVWNLILGYNGFGRLTGDEGSLGSGPSFGGAAGVWRMFNAEVGGQVAWLLPLAAVGLVAGLWLTRRAPRTDRARAAWVLFGVWALVHVAVFSSQQGIFHPYYVSALAPAVAALSGAGIVALWRWARVSWAGLAVLDATVAGSAWLAVDLLGRTPTFAPALRVVIPFAGAVAIVASVGLRAGSRQTRRLVAVAAVAGGLALLAGPAAFSYANLGRVLNGDNVVAGPTAADHGMGGGVGGRFGAGAPSGAPPPGARAGGVAGMGGTVSTTLLNYLLADQGSAKYLVAASGSRTTAPIIIATGKPVVTIGGFGGHDPAPTVSQLASIVAGGQLKYVLVGGFGGPGDGADPAVTTWVIQHGTAVSAVGTASGTLYRASA
jgi:4-amino-4-deoxy-L-arabinose transferase-like glycosyltransferase